MKLTNKQIEGLENILYHLQRAQEFINNNDTVVGRKSTLCNTDLFYNEKENFKIALINKFYGSNLTGLEMGIENLRDFINYYSQKK